MEIVVIGAGAAGLGTAGELQRHGLQAVVLERGVGVGESWRRRYDGLHLHTVRWLSNLPHAPIPRSEGRWVERDGVVRYLERYAGERGLDVKPDTDVTRIDRADGGWLVRTSSGDLAADAVVVATGHSNVPFVPDWPGRDTFGGELIHSANYRHAAPYKGRDVLVVGGGAAGCALAGRLSENPDRTVCLVEAGPDYGHLSEGRWPADILDPRWLALESHLWERTDEEDRSQSRARILGGCSAHNACVLLEGSPSDYDWGEEWSYEAFAPYLARANETLRGHVLADEELTPWHRAFREAGGAESIVHPVNIVDGVRWHTGFAYVDPARARGNLAVLGDTLVDRVLVEDGRARGAVAGGRELRADVVVVSAGAYGSPGILLRSGIGPDGEVAELPVGDGLVDHVGTGAAWEPTERLLAETAAHEAEHGLYMGQVTIAAASRSSRPGVRDMFVFPALDVGPEISGAAFAMKPRSRGSVRLNGPEPETPLAIDHGFLRDERDVEVVAEAFERLRELVESPEVRPYAGAELRPGLEVDVEEHVRASARGFFHPVGTCAIGSVVDERCRVLGFENLYVVDASAIPEIPSANTNLTTVALAERAAGWL